MFYDSRALVWVGCEEGRLNYLLCGFLDVTIKLWHAVLTYSELCSMVVVRTCIKVHLNSTIFESIQEAIQIEALQD